MSNFTDFISSGGGGGLPVNIILGYSQTWVPPVDGNICIHVVGAGGGGTGRPNTSYSGGAGGYCKKNSLAVTTSGSFTVVVGARGNATSNSGTAGTGGNSTVAGTGLSATLTANGGGGGLAAAGGAGGTAANGDVNNTGGAGNSYGGGAVGITGTGTVGSFFVGGGECDVQGPESLIGHGYICGGKGGRKSTNTTSSTSNYGVHSIGSDADGGFLSGGGLYDTGSSGLIYYCHAGSGGIGGGGGACVNDNNGIYAYGGNGGNGIVIIQYLPA